MLLRFGDFAPDAAGFESGVAPHLNNVVPGVNFYAPMKSLEAYSATALDQPCLGALSIREVDRNMRIFAGDAGRLYELRAADLAWTDVSRPGAPAYNVTSGEYWWMKQWKNTLLAGAGGVVPQVFDLSASTAFADLAGGPPTALHAGIIGPHLMLGNLTGAPNAVRWCAAADETAWTTGGGPGNGDLQEFVTGGHVRDVAGGRIAGYVFQESMIRRAYFVGGNEQFQFDVVVGDVGLEAPRSRVTVGGTHFFLSAHGFYRFDGQALAPIGRGRVDAFFYDNVADGDLYATWGAADQQDTKVYWVYSDGTNKFYLAYDYQWDRWGHGDMDADIVFALNPLGIDLDSLDAKFPASNLDTFPFSLDSRLLQGGTPTFGAFGTDRRLSTFTGANLAATIDTVEGQIRPGRRSLMTRARPQVEGATDASVTIGVRERLGDPVAWKPAAAQRAAGYCPVRASGRYHRARVQLPAGSAWDKAIGIEIEAARPLGER